MNQAVTAAMAAVDAAQATLDANQAAAQKQAALDQANLNTALQALSVAALAAVVPAAA